MKILILMGGTSGEREVSLRSGAQVAAACREASFEVAEYDTQAGLEGILDFNVDVVFPALHGAGGEDGAVQAFLDEHGIVYVGSGADSCRKIFDKSTFLKEVAAAGITTPQGAVVDHDAFMSSPLSSAPFVLKPIDGGSSLDTFIIRSGNRGEIPAEVFDKYPTMLLEELIEGPEITVSILGDEALPIVEIVPPEGEEFDYDNKYNGKSQELCPPVNVSAAAQRDAQAIALKIHQLLGCRHLSRVDFMISADEELYVLELNTLPGFTAQSLYPIAARAAGHEMKDLVKILVEMAAHKSK